MAVAEPSKDLDSNDINNTVIQAVQMQRKNDSGEYENYYPNTVMSQIDGDIQMKAKVNITANAGDNIAISGDSTQTVTIADGGTATVYLPYGNYTFINNTNSFTVKLIVDTIKTYEVVVKIKTLEEYSWAEISEISQSGEAANKFSIGDKKKIVLKGTIDNVDVNWNFYVFILDFNHDLSSANGTKDGITFGTFKLVADDETDGTLVSFLLNNQHFLMNGADTNSGGWKNCDMRYDSLGSTDTQNDDASPTTATLPVSNTLMSCFPSDLRAVMRPMYIYTDNTGGGSDLASYVTGTIDYLPLLAEYEVFGETLPSDRSSYYANSAERKYQTQYTYYKNGNSPKKKNPYNVENNSEDWLRSPVYYQKNAFVTVLSWYDYTTSKNNIAPMFKV